MKMQDCAGDFMSPVTFKNAAGLTAATIAEELGAILKEGDVSANIWADEVRSGGIFGSTYPCVMISHPNPPQSYFDHMIIINGDTLSFKYFGLSKAVFNRNKKAAMKEEGKFLKAALINDDEMAYNQEFIWHGQVKGAIKYYLNL